MTTLILAAALLAAIGVIAKLVHNIGIYRKAFDNTKAALDRQQKAYDCATAAGDKFKEAYECLSQVAPEQLIEQAHSTIIKLADALLTMLTDSSKFAMVAIEIDRSDKMMAAFKQLKDENREKVNNALGLADEWVERVQQPTASSVQ